MKNNTTNYDNFDLKPTVNDGSMNTKDFLIGALIGGIVGATTALFMAPKSGKELREDLNLQAGTLKERAGGWTDVAKEKSTELASVAKDKTSTLTKTVQDQSGVLVDKVKSMKQAKEANVNDEDTKNMLDSAEKVAEKTIQGATDTVTQKLEETKKAFDATEKGLNSSDSGSSSSDSSKPASSGYANPADVGVNEKKKDGVGTGAGNFNSGNNTSTYNNTNKNKNHNNRRNNK